MIRFDFNINDSERKRILGLHESATKKQYLILEQVINPKVLDFGTFFESGQYNFNQNYLKTVSDKVVELSEIIDGKKIDEFQITIIPGESQVPNQSPFQQKGSLANKRAEVLKDYLEKVLPNILGFTPKISIESPVIGSTEWNPKKGKDAPEYKQEQFLKVRIDFITKKTPTPKENINKGFLISVRGDEKTTKGVFYFPKTIEDWKKITYDTRMKGAFTNTEQRGDKFAQTSANMNDDVFRLNWLKNAPDLEKYLGPAYIRDPKNPNEFILK